MDSTGNGMAARYRSELKDRLASMARADSVVEPLEGVRIRHSAAPTELGHGVTSLALCVVAQGSKMTTVGGQEFRYNPGHYLITTATLPSASRIVDASREEPYLGLVLRLDPAMVSAVMIESGQAEERAPLPVQAIGTAPVGEDLLSAVVRVAQLAESPGDATFLFPLAMREIVYRLLTGEQGGRLRHIAAPGGSTHRIAEAIARLRREFDQPLRIETVARDLGMSVSGFHHHFKAVTAMSPLAVPEAIAAAGGAAADAR